MEIISSKLRQIRPDQVMEPERGDSPEPHAPEPEQAIRSLSPVTLKSYDELRRLCLDPGLAEVFFKVHRLLTQLGKCSEEALEAQLPLYAPNTMPLVSDNAFYQALVRTVFSSGLRTKVIDRYMPVIQKYFADYKVVMGYDAQQLEAILKDPEMIRNKAKVHACYKNALVLKDLLAQYGSFQKYLSEFNAFLEFSSGALESLKQEMVEAFAFLGERTALNLMADLGCDVVKPDRALLRALRRLNLMGDEEDLYEMLRLTRGMSAATRLPLRYIDHVLKLYGAL